MWRLMATNLLRCARRAPDLTPDRWTIRTIGNRVDTIDDPLALHIGRQQQLPHF